MTTTRQLLIDLLFEPLWARNFFRLHSLRGLTPLPSKHYPHIRSVNGSKVNKIFGKFGSVRIELDADKWRTSWPEGIKLVNSK
jgi:hypothetical protein